MNFTERGSDDLLVSQATLVYQERGSGDAGMILALHTYFRILHDQSCASCHMIYTAFQNYMRSTLSFGTIYAACFPLVLYTCPSRGAHQKSNKFNNNLHLEQDVL